MGTTIKGHFKTRRDAEMAVERLVQERGIPRTDIFVQADSSENTAGTKPSGADNASGTASGSPSLHGTIEVSADLNDAGSSQVVRDAFQEFGASNISGG